jgi:hypothetical protein
MKRSITWFGVTLGSAALIALGSGCSRESRPAQAPRMGTSSPTFESNVPKSPPPGPGYEPAPPMPPGQPTPPPSSTFQPETGEPGPQGAPEPPSPQPPMPTGENERQMCDDLAVGAALHVEDVQHGVTIVAIPKVGSSLSNVRDDAQRIETTMRQHAAGAAPSAPGSEACGLFTVARLSGVTTSLTEGTKSVRIVLTTTNPAEVKDLRRLAREQVQNLAKSGRAR